MTVENDFSFIICKYNQFTGELTFIIKSKFINNFKLFAVKITKKICCISNMINRDSTA